MEHAKELEYLWGTFSGEIWDFCYEVLDRFGENKTVFEYACVHFVKRSRGGNAPIKQHFSEGECDEYKSIYGDTVDGLLNSCVKKCNLGLIPSEKFYEILWASFCSNFTTRKEKAFAFYYTLIDPIIPYQYLGKTLTMSNEQFKEISKKNEFFIDNIRYIIKSGYTQRTERASLLLNCLDKIGDYESKVVVLSHAITIFNQSRSINSSGLDILIEALDKKIAEMESEDEPTEE